ncbi:patatin-like phospholipase family protein [Coleofasciculus sp.]|uniref:patatin-like phospholipase family protein n=1 Tax=Coleofasciculus sp. TaxID=3100458 RepID=UPI0039FA4E4F
MNNYKILSLDGGGFRGVISARILKEIEEKLKPRKLHEYFDLVAGTSTGSLIAAGIAKGKSADDLLKLYQNNGQKIFPDSIRKIRGVLKLTRGILPVALYPHKGLQEVLSNKEILGGTKISDITEQGKPVLLIPAYDTFNRKTVWFCSNNSKLKRFWYDDIEVWKICICSASAPTFFPPYQLKTPSQKLVDLDESGHLERHLNKLGLKADTEYPFVDGGIAVNNPALIAIAHAMLNPYKDKPLKQINLNNIAILSIGTGSPTKPYSYQEVKGWGMFGWATHLGDLFLPAPNEVNASVCWQLIRGEDDENAKRVLRLDFRIETDKKEDEELETIDNPHLYERFVQVAENYLHKGEAKVGINIKPITPTKAIERFIDNNP